MKRSLTKWYLSKSALELAELFAKSKRAHNVYHKSVLTNIHISSQDASQREILNVMFVNGKIFFFTNLCRTLITIAILGKHIVEKPDSSVAYKAYHDYRKLKRAETSQIVEILKKKEQKYQLDHLPSKVIRDADVWTEILPNLTTKIVLDLILRLNCYGMLKMNVPFSRYLAIYHFFI